MRTEKKRIQLKKRFVQINRQNKYNHVKVNAFLNSIYKQIIIYSDYLVPYESVKYEFVHNSSYFLLVLKNFE